MGALRPVRPGPGYQPVPGPDPFGDMTAGPRKPEQRGDGALVGILLAVPGGGQPILSRRTVAARQPVIRTGPEVIRPATGRRGPGWGTTPWGRVLGLPVPGARRVGRWGAGPLRRV